MRKGRRLEAGSPRANGRELKEPEPPGAVPGSGTRAWHNLTVAEVAGELGTHPENGLSSDSAALRTEAVERPPRRSHRALRILWNQLKGGVVVVLLIATAVSLVVGHLGDALAIAASVAFSVAFGFLTDWRADRALEALSLLSAPTARVIRGGLEHEVSEKDVRRGDLVVLPPGHIVVADGRLVAIRDLQVDESALTGESVPVGKTLESVPPATPLPDRMNMAYAGTTVLSGWGRMIATEIRGETELSRIGRLVAEQEKAETPLERQAERLGRRLALLAIVLSAGVTLLGLLRDRPLWLMLETGVILAIAAIPEGLPAVTTIALAVGVQRMARASSLVRRLAAVETLGCAAVICTDKTGTLTENAMRVTRVLLPDRQLDVTGSGYSPVGQFLDRGSPVEPKGDSALERLLEIAALCNDARLESHDGWHIHGSSTEGALLALARKGGIDNATLVSRFERLSEIAFSSDRKRMTVVARDAHGALWSFVKGSPEVLLPLCSRILRSKGEAALEAKERAGLQVEAHALGQAGYRVLALAFRRLDPASRPEAAEEDLTWTGLVGLIDPPRAGVKASIETLRQAGIRTVMVTGDQRGTAVAVAKELGLLGPEDFCIDSGQLAEFVREHRWEDLRQTSVFARVSPEDKLSIVRGLQAAGQVVAMTGDGINDAPALRAADIGIAIGRGAADIARESSDLVVTNGDYGALPVAVAEGRQIYANIRRAVHYLLLCSLATIGVLLISVVANLPLPMTPLQILWLNLVVHIFPAVALVLVPGESEVMKRPPRDPREPLLTWIATGMISLRSAVVAAAAIWIFTAARVNGSGPRSRTLVMVTLAMALLMQMLASLSERRPFWRVRQSLAAPLWLAFGGGLAIQVLAVSWPPLASVLMTAPLSLADWLRAAGISAVALGLVEVGKSTGQKRVEPGPRAPRGSLPETTRRGGASSSFP